MSREPSGSPEDPGAAPAGPRRIGLVLGTSAGGVGRHVRSLARQYVAEGVAVVVAAPPSTIAAFDFAAVGALVRPVPIGRAGTELRAVRPLRRALADCDLVHAHGLRATVAAALTRAGPLVSTWHNAVLARGPGRAVLAWGERLSARRSAVVIGVSPDLVERAEAFGARATRFIPVAAPTRPTRRSTVETRRGLGLPAGTPLVLCVARLHPQKSLEVLVAAAAQLADRPGAGTGLQVLIAGDGPQREALTAQIAARCAPVRLLGARDDIADLLAAADVVVSSSQWEGWPLSLAEALAAGRAIVATAVGGVPHLVADAARLVPPGDPSALADALGELLADPAARAGLERAARRRAGELPDEAATAAAVRSVYADVLAAGRAGPG